MTDFCEITGLSSENLEKFNYLHHYITKSKDIPTPDNDVLKGFIKPLENTVSANKIHNNDTKRRESLFKHLEKSIASKFSTWVGATRVTKLIQFLKIEGCATMYHIHGDCLFLLFDTLEKPATLSFISPF